MKQERGKRIPELVLPMGTFTVLIVLMLCFCLRMDDIGSLTNVTLASKPSFSADGVMNGTFQNAWGRWVNDNFCGHTLVVKCHNQIQYSLFRDGNGVWRLGDDHELIHSGYSLGTASRNRTGSIAQETFDAYAERVAGLQAALEAQGKDFVFLLTPYKTDV